jgi:hypothetical protein
VALPAALQPSPRLPTFPRFFSNARCLATYSRPWAGRAPLTAPPSTSPASRFTGMACYCWHPQKAVYYGRSAAVYPDLRSGSGNVARLEDWPQRGCAVADSVLTQW